MDVSIETIFKSARRAQQHYIGGCQVNNHAIKLGVRKSGEGCFFRCLLHTSTELLRGVGVSRTATLSCVLLFKTACKSTSIKHHSDYNKSANLVLVPPASRREL